MVTLGQWHLEEPATIHPPLHGVGRGVPIIEVTDQADGLGPRGIAVEVDWPSVMPGRVAVAGRFIKRDVHDGYQGEFLCLALTS
jgi:hypothetical protein